MDKLSQPLNSYLELAATSALLVGEADRANIDLLLTMLGPIDKDIMQAFYGLGNTEKSTPERIAARFKLKPEAIQDIVDKDLHRLSITPEWQMMLRQLPPMVRRRLGLKADGDDEKKQF